jgi:hypothetical protein
MTAVEWLVEQIKSEQNQRALSASEWIKVIEQAKQMEREQMIKFAEFVASHPNKNKNYLGGMLHSKSKYDGAERTVDLLEQYYNETCEQLKQRQ